MKKLQMTLLGIALLGAWQVAPAQADADAAAQPEAVTEETTAPDGEMPMAHNGLTYNGAVGLPMNPTANIPAQGSWRVQADYFDFGDLEVENDFADSPAFTPGTFGEDFGEAKFYGLHASTRPWRAPLELSIGVERLRLRGNTLQGPFLPNEFDFEETDDTNISLGAKWQAWRNEEGNTFVAIGAGYAPALFDNWHAYVVGTRAFGVGRRAITAHLGLRYDRFEVEGVDNIGATPFEFEGDSTRASIYAGVEVPIDRQGRWNFVGEIGSKNSSNMNFGGFTFPAALGDGVLRPKIPYSASIRYQNKGWAASLGIIRQGLVTDTGFFAQVGKTF